MSQLPWFKFFSSDYLTDSKVDEMPREAEGLLVRMWCVCANRGHIPADPAEIARLTYCDSKYVSKYVSYCVAFFEMREGKFFSHRMERERLKSEKARQSVNHRWESTTYKERNTDRSTKRNSNRTTQKSESETRGQKKTYTPPTPPQGGMCEYCLKKPKAKDSRFCSAECVFKGMQIRERAVEHGIG